MGPVQRRLLRVVLWVTEHPWTTLTAALVVLVGCVALAWGRLSVSTDQNKLFSPDEPHFRAYLEFVRQFPENEAIYVVVEPRDPHATLPVQSWVDIAEALSARLRSMDRQVRLVESRVDPAALGVYGFIFEEPAYRQATFDQFVAFADLLRLLGEKPGLDRFVLGRTPIERLLGAMRQAAKLQPAAFAESAPLVEAVTRSLLDTVRRTDVPPRRLLPDLAALDAQSPRRLGYFYERDASNPDRWLLLIRAYPKTNYTSLTALSETVEAIRAATNDVAKAWPAFQVALTGRPVLEADEMRTTDTDAHRAEVVAMIVVFIGIALMLRSIWLAFVAELSLAVGIGWTFGWATISVGELNLLSIVFVIALIGIGMDYLVQVLARYRREARRYARQAAIWARVYRYVSPPIFTACLGAAGAFLVSLFTDFRGAAELGVIAGGGLLLCLLAGYTVLPALLVIRPAKLPPEPVDERFARERPGRPTWRLWVVPALWGALLLAAIPLMLRSRFDPNLLSLQAPRLQSVQLVRKLQTWSAVVMSGDLDTLRRARAALADASTVGATDSILQAYDTAQWLAQQEARIPRIDWSEPEALSAQDLTALTARATSLADVYADAKLAPAAEALRQFAGALSADQDRAARERIAERLSAWQTAFVDQLRQLARQFSPPPLDVGALPEELRSHYVSDRGVYALYIYPRQDLDLWHADPLRRFVTDVESHLTGVPGEFVVTGIASNIFHTTGAIARSFVTATLLALGLILLLVWLDLRSIKLTLLAVSVLALGLPMLLALMVLMGVSWNFANFFGLPILIGAGHEYGVFMVHRYRESIHSPRRVWRWWDPADRALLLCAYITSSSFGFFYLLGHHVGLRSLGWVMAVGTACIYLAALLVLRPILRWWLRRSGLDRGTRRQGDKEI